jgi:hypothetical protein
MFVARFYIFIKVFEEKSSFLFQLLQIPFDLLEKYRSFTIRAVGKL